MSVIRVAFLGTPDFARFHLEALLADEHFYVVGVVSQPDRPSGRSMKLTPSPVKALALEKSIPVITPEKINDVEVLKEIQSWKAEAVVVVAYGQIVPQKFLDMFPKKVVNVHGSLLPRWRGAAPIQRALMAGDLETGVSLQVMVKKLDAGDVIGEYRLKIPISMDAVELHNELQKLGVQLLHVELMDYLRGHLMPTPQDESKVTYAHKIDKSESLIDWSQPAAAIWNHIRGLALGPGAHTFWQGKKIKIHRARAEAIMHEKKPGTIVSCDAESLTIACGEGVLRVTDLQPESKARMSVRDYLLGHTVKVGDIWG